MTDGQPRIWLVRHGETDWSRDGRHTSRTDIGLTPRGEAEARALSPLASSLRLELILCSPRMRAQRTAELAGLVPYEVTDDLREWDYGEFEGRTTADIRGSVPGWSIWDGPWQGGETGGAVTIRADRLLSRVRASGASTVGLVGHGHFNRVIGARWVGEEVSAGRWLDLDTATWCELGWSREDSVIRHWNVPVSDSAAP